MRCLYLVLALLAALARPAAAQPAAGDDGREADRAAIRAHIETIFKAYMDKDRATVRATHAEDWRGFLTGSRHIIRGLDAYMEAADGSLRNLDTRILRFDLSEYDVVFHGADVAVINYVADLVVRAGADTLTDKLRTLDVYARREGHWNQVASNVARHPEAMARWAQTPAVVPPAFREQILTTREEVWRAWFTNDRARLEAFLPAETLAGDGSAGGWQDRAAILDGAAQFAASGAQLVRLAFPRTEIQMYGNTIILYTNYEYELESGGKRETTTGKGTEVFVVRDNHLINTGWLLADQK
jgi:ketosteroid isomerase-like protein